MYPFELIKVSNFLNQINIEISEKHGDGRVNSIDDENTIIRLLRDEFGIENVEEPPPRHWWDVKVFGYPINIKSSAYGSAADNFSSKEAILWALTSLTEDNIRTRSWKDFQDKLATGKDADNGRDYYILSVNKRTNQVHLSSLKTLNKLTPNGNNLPFQIKWADNTQSVERTHRQAYDFLVGCYKESVKKKIAAHNGFEQL